MPSVAGTLIGSTGFPVVTKQSRVGYIVTNRVHAFASDDATPVRVMIVEP